jgi:hypothetical protein
LRGLFELSAGENQAQSAERVSKFVTALDPELEPRVPYFLTLLSLSSPDYPLPPGLTGAALQETILDALCALFRALAQRTPIAILLRAHQAANRAGIDRENAITGYWRAELWRDLGDAVGARAACEPAPVRAAGPHAPDPRRTGRSRRLRSHPSSIDPAHGLAVYRSGVRAAAFVETFVGRY